MKGRFLLHAEFITLYQKYKKPIFSYVYYLCGDSNLAEEICQDVFFKVYLNLGRFQGKSSFKTWIYRIARNTYLDYVKAQQKKLAHRTVELEHHLVAEGLGPEEHVLKRELSETVGRVLCQLDDKYRTLLILRDIQNLSYKEICQVTGLSLNNVKVGIYRARREFRKIYERWEGK